MEPETLERFGLTAVRARTRIRTLLHRRRARPRRTPPRSRAWPAGWRRGSLAGLAAGLLVSAGLEGLGPPAAVLGGGWCRRGRGARWRALPRMGWMLSALFVCGWLGTPEADRPGTALVLAAALAPTPLLLPRAGLLWSVPALAPLLGAVALAPAVRGRGGAGLHRVAPRRPGGGGLPVAGGGRGDHRRRAALRRGRRHAGARALGGLGGRRRERRPAARWSPRPRWRPSLVWAAFAVVLPFFVRGRWAAMDLLRRSAWAAGLVLAHGVLGDCWRRPPSWTGRAAPSRAPRWAAWWR